MDWPTAIVLVVVVIASLELIRSVLRHRQEYRVKKLEEDSARTELAFRELEEMDE